MFLVSLFRYGFQFGQKATHIRLIMVIILKMMNIQSFKVTAKVSIEYKIDYLLCEFMSDDAFDEHGIIDRRRRTILMHHCYSFGVIGPLLSEFSLLGLFLQRLIELMNFYIRKYYFFAHKVLLLVISSNIFLDNSFYSHHSRSYSFQTLGYLSLIYY